MKLLPALTTIVKDEWRNKINEIDVLGIKEIGLFPTAINFNERQELYKLLEKTNLQKIPFVHLREEDMDETEINYFVKRWSAEIFNVHPMVHSENFPDDLVAMTYVENTTELPEESLRGFAGICLDFSHLENDRRNNPASYENIMNLANKYPIGCAHIGAVYPEPVESLWKGMGHDPKRFDYHHAESNEQFDYLRNYPREMLPNIAAIELENPLSEQLKFRDYILDMLKI